MEIDDQALMALQVEALFVHDARGRLLHTREADPQPAPRFFLGRTRAGSLWRVRHDLPDALADQLNAIAAGEPPLSDPRQKPVQLDRIRELLCPEGEAAPIEFGPAYCFPDLLPPSPGTVWIGSANRDLCCGELAWLQRGWEVVGPVMASVADGRAVSVCFCARLTPRAAEAGVETLEAFRGQGHATRAVAAWARAIRAIGCVPLYSTSWENVASQGVARKLGLRLYGTDFSLA
jgi:hypothetical protein